MLDHRHLSILESWRLYKNYANTFLPSFESLVVCVEPRWMLKVVCKTWHGVVSCTAQIESSVLVRTSDLRRGVRSPTRISYGSPQRNSSGTTHTHLLRYDRKHCRRNRSAIEGPHDPHALLENGAYVTNQRKNLWNGRLQLLYWRCECSAFGD